MLKEIMKNYILLIVFIFLISGCSINMFPRIDQKSEFGSIKETVEEKNPVIHFYDSAFQSLIEEVFYSLGHDEGTEVRQSDLLEITSLEVGYDCGISIINGIRYCSNLETFMLPYNNITDLSEIAFLSSLKKLHLHDNQSPLDLTPLSFLKNLEQIYLQNVPLVNADEISGLTTLKELNLSNTQITESSPSFLENLINLEKLNLADNHIADISALENMIKLKELDLSNNGLISNLGPLEDLISLEKLYLSGNNISDMSSLSELSHLQELDLSENELTDLTILRMVHENGGLQPFGFVVITGNPVENSENNSEILDYLADNSVFVINL